MFQRTAHCFAAVCCALLLAGAATAHPPDPLIPLLNRIDSYFHRYEIEGVTQDPRYALNPTETTRLSVVSQLLAYCDLYDVERRGPSGVPEVATNGGHGHRQDIVDRADFLLEHYGEILSGTAFDGMTGYAFLEAYDMTGDTRYLAAGRQIVNECEGLYGFQNTLNWGLMAGMGLAKYYALTGDPVARAKALSIVGSCASYQHANGSFPHYCPYSTDVHYTDWMGMELVHIGRYLDDPRIGSMLDGVDRFLNTRVDTTGHTSYETVCPQYPGCVTYYYGYRSGCPQDYDTRAWVNELGYSAIVFDRYHDPAYADVMGFLYALGPHGVFPDKWGFPPPVSDPIYPWGSADSSVIRTSVVFWSLATVNWARHVHAPHAIAFDAPPTSMPSLPPPVAFRAGRVQSGAGALTRIDLPEQTNYHWQAVDSLVLANVSTSAACPPPADPGMGAPPFPQLDRPVAGSNIVRFETGAKAAVTTPVTLRFELRHADRVRLEVLDAQGRRVRTLAVYAAEAGVHEASWDGRDDSGVALPSGVYWASLRAGGERRGARVAVLTR